jgi:hypothetical protein
MQREIEDVDSGVSKGDIAVKDYVDITPLSSAVDQGLQRLLENLRKKLGKKVNEGHDAWGGFIFGAFS